MRARELRWRRSLRGIALTVLASPLAGAACHSSTGAPPAPDDASVADEDAAASARDASAPGTDATAIDGGAPLACDPSPLDAASFEDAADGCADFRLLPCGIPPEAGLQGCYLDLATCARACGTNLIYYCRLGPGTCSDEAGVVLDSDAAVVVDCVSCGGASGRRPRGLAAPHLARRTPLGDYFASMAHLESASVRAFRDLEASLVTFGAPRRLTRAARRAAADERRHARVTARLARRFGGVPPRPRVARVTAPSLAALLEDDVIEGCVGETFGALVAIWQAERAADPRVRRTMGRIAEDETRHAALAWEILDWGLGRLPLRERDRLEKTLDRALLGLARTPPLALDAEARRICGHPAPADARRLAGELGRVLRSAANRIVMRERPAGPRSFA